MADTLSVTPATSWSWWVSFAGALALLVVLNVIAWRIGTKGRRPPDE
jgi:hypothetical protein